MIVLTLLLFIAASLPFALGSVAADLSDQSTRTYVLLSRTGSAEAVHADLRLEIIAVNEWEGTASIRVTAHQSCQRVCPWGDRYLFVSVFNANADAPAARPASESVTLAATERDVTQVIKLPIFGDPIRYPFDRYRLGLGILLDRIAADGGVQTLTRTEASDYFAITLQPRIPRVSMGTPTKLDPDTVQADNEIEPYISVTSLTFGRPLYLKVLTLLLVLLVSAAAAYAVFMRPLDQLIINSGALVLGVWGIRSILLGTAVPGWTIVDLSLSVVILFLLATITVRTLWLLEQGSHVKVLRRIVRPKPPVPSAPAACDFVPGAQSRDGPPV